MSDRFAVTATDAAARAGVLRTAHGEVPTPAFMPVGTKATVKTVDPDELRALGAEIVLCNTYHLHFRPGEETIHDLGPPAGCPREELEEAVRLTTLWAARQRAVERAPGQLLFGIAQGGTDTELRRRSIEEITATGFDGYALGGLAIGESRDVMFETTCWAADLLPHERPRYFMG